MDSSALDDDYVQNTFGMSQGDLRLCDKIEITDERAFGCIIRDIGESYVPRSDAAIDEQRQAVHSWRKYLNVAE